MYKTAYAHGECAARSVEEAGDAKHNFTTSPHPAPLNVIDPQNQLPHAIAYLL